MTYLYAIIPYKSGISFSKDAPCQSWWEADLPELNDINLEIIENGSLQLFSDFLMVNTCNKLFAFTDNKDVFCRIRSEIYQIARALRANEVWYVEELVTDEMFDPEFCLDYWINALKTEKKHLVAELSVDSLKSKEAYSCYHDDFADIIIEQPKMSKK